MNRKPGDRGTALDAIDFILDGNADYAPGDEFAFLQSWRTGALEEWPEFYVWLAEREARR